MATGELACTYAALILHDDGIDITAEKISTLVKTANLNIESYWSSLFAKLCQNRSIDDLIMNAGASGSSATAAAAPMAVSSSDPAAAAGGATQASPVAEQKKKEEVKEESEDDMVFGLFD